MTKFITLADMKTLLGIFGGKTTRLPINWQISRSHPHPHTLPHLWTWHWWQWWGVEGRWVVMTVAGGEARGEEVMTWTSGDTVVTIVVNTVVTGGCGVNYQTWHNGLLTVSRAVSGPGPGFCCGFPTLDITSPFPPLSGSCDGMWSHVRGAVNTVLYCTILYYTVLYLVMGCGHTWGGAVNTVLYCTVL